MAQHKPFELYVIPFIGKAVYKWFNLGVIRLLIVCHISLLIFILYHIYLQKRAVNNIEEAIQIEREKFDSILPKDTIYTITEDSRQVIDGLVYGMSKSGKSENEIRRAVKNLYDKLRISNIDDWKSQRDSSIKRASVNIYELRNYIFINLAIALVVLFFYWFPLYLAFHFIRWIVKGFTEEKRLGS